MEKGYSINNPPLFKGVKYDYWKERMIAHFEFLLNSKAQNALLCALSEEEYTKLHSYKSAKQMWHTLVLTYEGLPQVKYNKLSLLTHKYELFTMEEGQDIQIWMKIRNMWKKRNELDWKGSKKPYRERKDKDKSSIICYKCKKSRHFKSKCPNLDKIDHKKRYFKPKDKKEEEEKANLCLMANTTTEGSESDEETNNSSKISTQPCGDFESLKLKTTKLHLENEEICKEKYSLLEDLQKLNNHLEGLQNEYATLSKLHDCLNEEMYVVTLQQDIGFLRQTLSKFVGSTKKLNKMLRYRKCPTEKSRNGYKGKKGKENFIRLILVNYQIKM
ncbi:hypothetical protein JHK82_019592 [Glycine max]|uniref:CCHC-type domain-containing protein n=2 Tax=Glycine subgen. Soja TaxID=1462606 RepID=A0A0R0JFM0_SOYBN|nr:hypothetical protein JHK85_020032 [Glycine max]KAG5038767.1 hypothetical protein JHK86_019607 [Glycine max]KAG5143897.1 hypothetical protein JHK82_019592 [Glycine max]KAH1088200.1 hypothetical protein GYH30_019307 [Glycine max]RZC04253.1 hypothetical protein D0Y65_018727 [Glycine soja]